MKYENFLTKTKEFVILRITELVSLILILVSIAIFLALISYSPNDPNFIVNSSDIIKNFLGLRGSIVSDFLFQSVGLISYLIPFTLFFSGTNIFINKKYILFIDNLFFCVLYLEASNLAFLKL